MEMKYALCIRKVRQDDAEILAYIQTTSWEAAFKNIIGDDGTVTVFNWIDRFDGSCFEKSFQLGEILS